MKQLQKPREEPKKGTAIQERIIGGPPNRPSKGAPHNTKGGRQPPKGRAPEANKLEVPVKQVIAESKQREVTNPHGALNDISPLMKDKNNCRSPVKNPRR